MGGLAIILKINLVLSTLITIFIDMKKYLQNRKCNNVNCDLCGKTCSKPVSEIKRNTNLGRKMFCSRACSVKYGNSLPRNTENRYDISKHAGNSKDEFTGFRYMLRSAKSRYKDFDLTLQDLKDIWESQNGMCPYTGFALELRTYKKKTFNRLKQASLDRIDSSKGYIKDNVEIVALPINYLKSSFSKEETQTFLKEFALSFNKDWTISSSSYIEE